MAIHRFRATADRWQDDPPAVEPDPVLAHPEGPVLVLTLNRPERLNAVSLPGRHGGGKGTGRALDVRLLRVAIGIWLSPLRRHRRRRIRQRDPGRATRLTHAD